MDSVILREIHFRIDETVVFEKLRLKENSEYRDRVMVLISEGCRKAKPKGFYQEVKIEKREQDFIEAKGIKLHSRILRVNTEDVETIFPFVATCGTEIDDWAKSFGDIVDRYVADLIQEMACQKAVETVFDHIQENYSLINPAHLLPGSLTDWPIDQQAQLFSLMGNPQHLLGMELTDHMLMKPVKSLSGIRFDSKHQHVNCQLCPKEKCPGRRSPYESELYDKNYGSKIDCQE